MPTTYDADRSDEEYARVERKKFRIFKIVETAFWLAMVIIVVALCLASMHVFGYIQ